MDEKKIKSALKSQLDPIKMNPHLQQKTMNYIRTNPMDTLRSKYRCLGGALGALTFCICTLLVIGVNRTNHLTGQPEVSMLSEGADVSRVRQTTLEFERITGIVDQLNLSYEVGNQVYIDSYIVTPLVIDGSDSYYVELSTAVDNYGICEWLTENDTNFKVIQLDDRRVFFYSGMNEELINQLLTESTLLCR